MTDSALLKSLTVPEYVAGRPPGLPDSTTDRKLNMADTETADNPHKADSLSYSN